MIVASAPGKLYVAGEYAVVEPSRRAVLIAVDRRVRVELRASSARDRSSTRRAPRSSTAPHEAAAGGCVRSAGADYAASWRHGDASIEFDDEGGYYGLVIAALDVVERLRRERGLERHAYALHIESSLDDAATGHKLGLGSSAAVVVATVAAIGALYRLDLDAADVYRLAMIATVRHRPETSGGDIAACALGGWVSYASPDRAWLAETAAQSTLDELLRAEWPGLELEALGVEPAFAVHVGWTGRPASTSALVASVRSGGARYGQARDEDASAQPHRAASSTGRLPPELTARSDATVLALIAALRAEDALGVRSAIEQARSTLREIGQLRGTVIETDELRALCDAAVLAGAWAKSSGAGGGDCGIAVLPKAADSGELEALWRRAGIVPLGLRVSAAGVTTEAITDIETEGEPA